jgi:hypothetical protein
MPNPPDPLDRLLDRWTGPSGGGTDVSSEVWRRIAQEARRPRGLGAWWAEIDGWLARPPFAALFVACCALLGLFLAEVRVNHQQREQSALLAQSYLQLIDPLLKADAAAKAP